MLTDSALKEPAPNACGVTWDTYQKWLNDGTTMRSIIRIVMSDEFSRKFEDAQLEEMLQVLNESFSTPDNVEGHKTNCAIFNIQMREGALVTDHVLYMIE